MLPVPMPLDLQVLLSAEVLQKRVLELGQEITADMQRLAPTGATRLCVIGVLKGAFIFLADLLRAIKWPVLCDFIGISSYGNSTESSSVVQITSDLSQSIEGMHVLIVEDIVDTGLSMRYLLDNLATRHPLSLKVCTLLQKPSRTKIEVPLDYVGFVIPNEFVVGYGLDYAGEYRNLPYLGIYKESP